MKKLQKYLTVGAAATLSTAQATIVYTDVDPDQSLTLNGDHFEIDFNGDGNIEYDVIFNIDKPGGGGWGPDVYQPFIQGFFGNQVAGYFMSGGGWGNPMLPNYFLATYTSGVDVDANMSWNGDRALFGYYFTYNGPYGSGTGSMGQWQGKFEKFVGLKFTLNGNTHYGWARFDVDFSYQGVVLKDFAYNDEPDQPIETGLTYDPNYIADSLQATDASDFQNGLDLRVNFKRAINELGISEYRVIAVKSSNANNFTIGDANACSYFKSITPNGGDIDTTFNEFSKDSDGDYIVEDEPYQVFVLTTPDLNNLFSSHLSQASNEVTLLTPVDTTNDDTLAINQSVWNDVVFNVKGKSVFISSNTTMDELQIFDIHGRSVYQNTSITQDNIDLSGESRGIFLIQINVDGIIETKKIII